MTRASRWIARHVALYSEKVFLTYNGERTEKRDSSLTSLRKDNEVKLKDEIKIVCNE